MSIWKEMFEQKLITAQQAADKIKNGDRIMTGNRDCRAVLHKLLARTDLENVGYYAPIINYMPDVEAVGKWFHPCTGFLNDSTYSFHSEGRVEFIPGEYWQYHKTALNSLQCNVAFLEVSRPDENGYMSMGTGTDFIRKACSEAELVVVETNKTYPFVYGTNLIHVSEVDFIVDGDEAENYLMEGAPVNMDEESIPTYKAIGGYLSDLIDNEATIEVGLGRLNAASLMYLENRHDLGVHTEVYGDILMMMTERGIITNQKKSENKGKAVFTQVVGTRKLFDWLEHNHCAQLCNCQEVLNPGNIARQHRMTAINNSVEVDLLGQANAEYLKGKQYSGMGGISNFATGAAACPDGKSIVVLESVTKNGKFSKITPFFKPGVPVSLPRTAIEYVVTEQGVAKLVGKSPAQRAKELIQVAHPKFRDELTFQAKELGIF